MPHQDFTVFMVVLSLGHGLTPGTKNGTLTIRTHKLVPFNRGR